MTRKPKDKAKKEEKSIQIATKKELKGVSSFDGVGAFIAGLTAISSVFLLTGVPVAFILGMAGLWKFLNDHEATNRVIEELRKLNEDIEKNATDIDKIQKNTIPQRAHIIRNALDAMVKNIDPDKFAYYRKAIVESLQPEFNDINMEHAWKIARTLEQLSPGELSNFCNFIEMEEANKLPPEYEVEPMLINSGLVVDKLYMKVRSDDECPYGSTEAGKKLYGLIKSVPSTVANDGI